VYLTTPYVWRGLPKSKPQAALNFSADEYYGRGRRRTIDRARSRCLLSRVCWVRQSGFHWLQTDVVSLRKDLVTPRGRHAMVEVQLGSKLDSTRSDNIVAAATGK
jgi:hypothetical protein